MIKANNRITWLDSSRGLAFLMVIYSHFTSFEETQMMRYFSPVFLTTFFFVSGYLTKSGCSFGKVFEQRTRTLFIPQLIFGLLLVLSTAVVTFKQHDEPLVSRLIGLVYPSAHHSNILWFIIALWAYSLVFYWLERFSKSYKTLLGVSTVLLIANWSVYKIATPPDLPYFFGSLGYGCFYMSLGFAFRKIEQRVDKVVKGWMLICAFLVYMAVISLTGFSCSFYGSTHLIDAVLLTVLGIFIMVYVSKLLPIGNNRFILFVGSNSLLYFCFHGKVLSFLDMLMQKFIYSHHIFEHSVMMDIAVRLSLTIVDALIVIIPVLIVNRWMPFLTGKGYKLWNAK